MGLYVLSFLLGGANTIELKRSQLCQVLSADLHSSVCFVRVLRSHLCQVLSADLHSSGCFGSRVEIATLSGALC